MVSTSGCFECSCDQCRFASQSKDIENVLAAVREHRKKTSHTISWKTIEFDPPLEESLGPVWVISCRTCHQTWEFGARKETETFAERHRDIVGHSPDAVSKHEKVPSIGQDVKTVIERLGGEFDYRVPYVVLVDVLSHVGIEMETIDNQLNQLYKRKEIYKPRGDRYRLV